MKKLITLAAVMLMSVAATYAQDYNQITDDGTFKAISKTVTSGGQTPCRATIRRYPAG